MKIPNLPTRYSLGSILGVGGSGRVYRVHDSIRGLELALKLVSSAEATWLRQEFDTLRQIRHENLIEVFDWGTLRSGEAFYTMELIHGDDWGERMRSPQSPDEVRKILTGLLRGLAHLHCHAEIHGDLKPGNVLLGDGGIVKVTDVGMRGASGELSRQSGTPGYAAPEVWEGKESDVRSDLYSVGVMAYEALTGKHPFAGRTVRDVISGQLEGWVPSPAAHGVRIPADLERVVMRAVERNPALRQGSADEFMDGMAVEDRIGEILGGPLVGRIREISSLRAFLSDKDGGAPTLIHVVGPPGSGKSALIEESVHAATEIGARCVSGGQIPSLSLAHLVHELGGRTRCPDEGRGQVDLTAASEALWAIAREAPVFVWFDPARLALGPVDDLVRPLARYLWALSLERKAPTRLLFLVARDEALVNLEGFECEIRLESLSGPKILDLVKSMLGDVEASQPLTDRLTELSGGLPGSLWLVLRDLMDKGILNRNKGRWTFRELDQLDTIEAPTLTSRWEHAWINLPKADQAILSLLALLPRGLDLAEEAVLKAVGAGAGSLAVLEARGWVKLMHGRSSLASEGIRRVIRSRAGNLLLDGATVLLAQGGSLLDREGRADLILLTATTPEALEEGIWAGSQAEERGDLGRACDRYRESLRLANELGDQAAAGSVAYRFARVLHLLGKDSQAEKLLENSAWWPVISEIDSTAAQREHLLGSIASSRGRIDAARRHLESAAEIALSAGDKALHIQCHADLGELGWRHGDEASRTQAIGRMRTVLSTVGSDPDLSEARSALIYGIGAALIYLGDATAAREVLVSGLGEARSDYWRARLANALGSAAGSLGENDTAMKWYTDAWAYAEKANAALLKSKILANRGATLHGVGRIRESIDLDRQAAVWARRVGNKFDYAAACIGTAIGLVLLARYEDALRAAKEASRAGEESSGPADILKGMELEALTFYHLGAYGQAEEVLRKADNLMGSAGRTRVGPRLNWLWARLLRATGRLEEAEGRLRSAEEELRMAPDLEDLLSVQVELHSLTSKRETARESVGAIVEIRARAAAAGILFVELLGVLAAAEILARFDLDDRNYSDLMIDALARSERAGFVEVSWRITYWLGIFAGRHGDVRTSQLRLAHALRLIREIAGGLSPEHRESYLNSPHIRSALESNAAAS